MSIDTEHTMPATLSQFAAFGIVAKSMDTFSTPCGMIQHPCRLLTLRVHPIGYRTWQAALDSALDGRYRSAEAARKVCGCLSKVLSSDSRYRVLTSSGTVELRHLQKGSSASTTLHRYVCHGTENARHVRSTAMRVVRILNMQ